jgi:opacity protein-like surface antigen
MRGLALLAGLVILAANGAARAVEPEPEPDYGRTGIYASIAGLYALEKFDYSDSADNSFGLNGRVGYRVLPRLGLEVQAEWAHGFDISSGGSAETWAVTANARAYFTESRIQPYVILGFGFLTQNGPSAISGKGIGFAARAGAGVDIGITDRIAVVLEGTYVGATGNVSDVGYGSLLWGVQYRF